MVTVTRESLAARIAELEAGPRSLKEDFALQAYRMLLPHISADQNEFIKVAPEVFYAAVHSMDTEKQYPNMDDIEWLLNDCVVARRIGARRKYETDTHYIQRKYVGVSNG